MTTTAKPDGNALIDQIVQEPTMDTFFAVDPVTLTDEQLLDLVRAERRARAMFIEKDAAK